MKRLFLGLVAGSSALAATAAEAQTRGGFQLGYELLDYSYRERLDGEEIVFDDGTFGGLNVNYVETLGGGWFLRARALGATGSVDYRSTRGGLIDPQAADPGPGTRLQNVDQRIGQFELTVGHDFGTGGTTITAFMGFATRVLTDKSGGEVTDDGFSGYDREITYGFVPLGLSAGIATSGRSRLLLSAQYNWVVTGRVESKFSDLDPAAPDVEVDLDGGHGLEASAMLELPLGRRAISFGPFVRHWDIEQSKSFVLRNPDDPSEAVEFFEPENRTSEVGIRVLFSF